ncbi:MAG: PQQ-binding-like beta-propeller repeat protein [Alphaproteobacteria bacterium]|nr:PQQ-binding-like beta-propeller repeat protein [Alphaproteobacteria bacterium]
MRRIGCLLLLGLLCAGCAPTGTPAPRDGRESIVPSGWESMPADKTGVKPARAQTIKSWTTASANGANNPRIGTLSVPPQLAYTASVGTGVGAKALSMAPPLVKDGVIYALDAAFRLTAVHMETGARIWSLALTPRPQTAIQSVGLVIQGGLIYAVSGDGGVAAVRLNGTPAWEAKLGVPVRAHPMADDRHLYVLSADNGLHALDAATGAERWRYQTRGAQTSLFGMGAPVLADDKVIALFSTGEVSAFDAQTGTLVWSESVLPARAFSLLGDLAGFTASPVVAGDALYVVGQNKVGAFRLSTGAEIWTRDKGGAHTPRLTGNALVFVSGGELIALNKATGAVFWRTPLTSAAAGPARWFGPTLTDTQAVVTSSAGDMVFVNVLTGKTTWETRLDKMSVAPILAGDRMIVLTDRAELRVYR